ncbi:MAG: hypothetical protein GXY36_03880 [Chloroflexi bacterium]|nr:hypothetical protein [Chloroflexota bacterium]
MTTPYDGRILWWHWKGSAVSAERIDELAALVKTETPNAAGIALKTSNGRQWQGEYDDPNAALAISGPESIARWVETLNRHGLETHLWCVVHGRDVDAEAERIIEACHVPGVHSMILDVEAGERYFGSQPPATARALITRVRRAIPADFHLGLCAFVGGDELETIHIDEWLPHVQSLHPMIYHWDFSQGTSGPRPYIDDAFARLAPYARPVAPILQTYADPHTGQPVPGEHIIEAGQYAFERGAAGISFFRLGHADDTSGPEQFAAVRRIEPRRPYSEA